MNEPWMPFLETLRRVPDDVILASATREFYMSTGSNCVCGWVMREAIGRRDNVGAEDALLPALVLPASSCQRQFGGTESEWGDIYWGVCNDDDYPLIERAFVERVKEAAGVAS